MPGAMPTLTRASAQAVEDLRKRYDLSEGAIETLLDAIVQGGGSMAQFDCPELGGHGQWMRGGMTLLGSREDGDKAKVAAVCEELAKLYEAQRVHAQPWVAEANVERDSRPAQQRPGPDLARLGVWYPPELGTPSASGGQNGMHYAVFPDKRRLAIDCVGSIDVYDTAEHQISGVQQAQGKNACDLCFTSQEGTFGVDELERVEVTRGDTSAPGGAARDETIEALARLGELRRRGVLTEDEFAAKKTELLARV